MSAATTFPLMTVEQFEALPEPKGGFLLRTPFWKASKGAQGKQGHYLLQRIIRDLFQDSLMRGGGLPRLKWLAT
jgi:hypothetical protein